MKPVRPKGFAINPYQTWLLVNRPQPYTAGLRKRFGDVVALYGPRGESFVIALKPEGARQILSADPNGYDAFWKEGFTGVVVWDQAFQTSKCGSRWQRLLLTGISNHPRLSTKYGTISPWDPSTGSS
jgi:hypothetical protein